jgi:molybdate transport system regulatory protein
MAAKRAAPQPRLRILLGESTALGPGKADLLAHIGRTGSIAAAAREMGMSYRRAWLLVRELNDAFVGPVVIGGAGGTKGGGARVTELGETILAKYRAMETRAREALAPDLAEFRRLLAARED